MPWAATRSAPTAKAGEQAETALLDPSAVESKRSPFPTTRTFDVSHKERRAQARPLFLNARGADLGKRRAATVYRDGDKPYLLALITRIYNKV